MLRARCGVGGLRGVPFGLAAAVAQVAIDPGSRVPMVGASGAIAGVLAGYVALYPRARILTLVPIFIFIQFMELPAVFFIFIWFGMQLLMGMSSLGQLGQQTGGVAFFARIGGFVAGMVLIRVLRPGGRPGGPGRRRVYHRPRAYRSQRGQWGFDRHRTDDYH